MFLAVRNLSQERTRLALSVAGVALAVMLILILNGFLSGMFRQISAYLERVPGSIVIAQEGVTTLLGASSLLPPSTPDAVKGEEGVVQAVPILSQFVILDLHGKKQPAYLVGYDPVLGAGPWRLNEGREPTADSEVVLDRVLASRHDIRLGERFEITGIEFTVVGLSEGTTSWMLSFVFIRKTAAESLFRAPGATSMLFVAPSGETAAEELRDRLLGPPGREVLLKRDMIANDKQLWGRIFSSPIRLMAGIAFLVGTLVVGLVIYTATVERQGEYGVLKAIGARNRTLYAIVTAQALVAAGLGSLLGVGLAFGVARLIMALRTQFLITIEPSAIGQALVTGLFMALLAAVLPARVMAGLAPADVFRR